MSQFTVKTPMSQRLLLIVAIAALVLSGFVNVQLLLMTKNQHRCASITVINAGQ